MKLFIVTCLKDYQEHVQKIFKEAKISVFSATDIIGYKNQRAPNLLEEWFATGDEKFDSLMIFSFTDDANAEHGLALIKNYNEEKKIAFPVRAFIVPVEKSIY
jgi:hypothetical protein